MSRRQLHGEMLQKAVAPLLMRLGESDRDRVEKLLALFLKTPNAKLSDCLAATFGSFEDEKEALVRFRNFRLRLNGLAEEKPKIVLKIESDTKKRTPTNQRHVWWMGETATVKELSKAAYKSTLDVMSLPPVESSALRTTLNALAAGKSLLRWFVVYAPSEESPARELFVKLKEEFVSQSFQLDPFAEPAWIPAEGDWHERIQAADAECVFGLLLVSPALIQAAGEGLRRFVGAEQLPLASRIVPVELASVDLQAHGLSELESRLFAQRESHVCLPYLSHEEEKDKRQFTRELSRVIDATVIRDTSWAVVLAGNNSMRPRHDHETAVRDDLTDFDQVTPKQKAEFERDEFDRPVAGASKEKPFARPYAFPTDGKTAIDPAELKAQPRTRVDALQELESWVRQGQESRNEPSFLAVLGEYGIGKTTTLMKLTQRLLELRQEDVSVPQPIFVDLRKVRFGAEHSTGGQSNATEISGSVPSLRDVLTSAVIEDWKGGDRLAASPEEIKRLVREDGAVIIFDGLDEQIVHLGPKQAQEFIRNLWSILPEGAFTRRNRDKAHLGSSRSFEPMDESDSSAMTKAKSRAAARRALAAEYLDETSDSETGDTKRQGKIIISCRSHYFRDVSDQAGLLGGEDREGRWDFRALCLLPFTEEQIRSYLKGVLETDEKAEAAFRLFQSIHNLEELAQRPYLLALMTEHLDKIEQLRQQKKTVNAARLYQLLTQRWLVRDNGKHTLDIEHKRELIEQLAWEFARGNQKEWDVAQLEHWFDDFLRGHERMAEVYRGRDRSVLKEDFRTATFVLRPDSSEKSFRFAHTSLQEFFLACRLVLALKRGEVECWRLPPLSQETLEFVGQLLQLESEEHRADCLESLDSILEGMATVDSPWSGRKPDWAASQKRLSPNCAARLALQYWLIARNHGLPEPTPDRVIVAGENFAGWRFGETWSTIQSCSPSNPSSDFSLHTSDSNPNNDGDVENVPHWNLRMADFSGCELERTIWRRVDLTEANFSETKLVKAEFQSVRADRLLLDRAQMLNTFWRDTSAIGLCGRTAEMKGNQWIRCNLTYAELPDDFGTHGLFFGLVGWPSTTVLEVKASTESCFLSIRSSVENLPPTFSENHLILRLPLMPSGAGWSCAWSPSGREIVSSSADNSLIVWDAENGQVLRTLRGFQGSVYCCAWSPGGHAIVAASVDGNLKVCRADNGQVLQTLRGHRSWVNCCAWSPDGRAIVSASADNSLKVWDVENGKVRLSLYGHQDHVRSCAWSPDGRAIVSASDDHSLKVWDAEYGQVLRTLKGHQGYVLSCGWSPDGRAIVSASDDHSLKVWDAKNGQLLHTLMGHQYLIRSCAWSPDSRAIVSASADHSLKVWNAQNGQVLHTLLGHQDYVRSCAWSPDGRTIVSASSAQSLKVWDAESGQELMNLCPLPDHNAVATSRDHHRILSATPHAWRYLTWQDTQTLLHWPAESHHWPA